MNTTVPVAVPSTNHDIPIPIPTAQDGHTVPPTSAEDSEDRVEMTDSDLEKLDSDMVIGGIISVGGIRQLGKEFRMTTECFLPRSNEVDFWQQPAPTASELASEPPKRVAPGATAREKKHAQNICIWRRLYTFLPERVRPLLRHSLFISVFEYAGRCIRKHWTLTLRRAVLPLVFEHIPLSAFANTSAPLRVGNQAITQLLFWPDSPATHSLFPPFVYMDGLCDHRKLLLNELLMKILRGLIKGPSSIGPDAPKMGRPKTSAEMWGLTDVNPGLMVLIITLVRFILSTDLEFARIGLTSGVPYADFYHETMDFLIIGRNTPTVKRIFATWNEIVFGRAPTIEPTSSDRRERPAGSEVADLLRELALENGTVGPSSPATTTMLAPFPDIITPSTSSHPRPSTISLTQASQITTRPSTGTVLPIVSFNHNITATIIPEAEDEPEGSAPAPVPAVPRPRQKRKATPAARTRATRSTSKNGQP